jgi:hypothetical protein
MGTLRAFDMLIAFIFSCYCPTDSFVAVRPKLSRHIDSSKFRNAISSAWPINDEVLQVQGESGGPKVGVLLLNLGGPETGDDVEGKGNLAMAKAYILTRNRCSKYPATFL